MAPIPAIPGYELLERIAGAGDASVHRARDLNSGRLCALSILRSANPPTAEQEERQVRFLEQGKQLLEFRHAHVVRTYDVGSGEGASWIAQELVDGPTLHDVLERLNGPLDAAVTLAIGVQLGWALAAMDESGIVHRDVCTENVLLSRDGVARLAGFGLAFESSYERLSTGQAPLGTVDFLSPEQVEADAPPTPKTDVYALGAVLYRCLAGRVPHSGATLFTRLRAIAHDAPPDLRELNPGLPDAVAELVGRFMEWDPDDRPLSDDLSPLMSQVSEALGHAGQDWQVDAVAALVDRLGGKPPTEPETASRVIVRLRGTDRTIERDLELGEGFDVGRAQDASVSLRFGWISRRHARVEYTPEGVRLTDLRSANGTKVNEAKVEGSVILETGDLVAFGKSRFEIAIRSGGRAQVSEQQCVLCGQDLAGQELEDDDEGQGSTCVRCQTRAEVNRKAAESRIQLALEESHFDVLTRLGSEGLFKRFRVNRRRKGFLVSALELGQRSAKLFAERSARAMELKHPALLATYDLQVHGGILFVVNEDHPGSTLHDLVAGQGPLSAGEAATLGLGLCDGLEYAIRQKLFHTLVRPDLVLMSADGSGKLLDAGLAPGLLEASRTRGGPGSRASFTAPEVIDVRTQTPAGIVYSIGATLSYALTGSPVAEVRSGERYEHLPLTMVATVPGPLARLLSRCTAHETPERPPTPLALRHELETLLSDGVHDPREELLESDEITRPPGDLPPIQL